MSAAIRCLVAAVATLAVVSPALARISDEERAAAEAFQSAVRGEREFGTDFMVKPPAADEREYLMNLGSCEAGGMHEGRDDSIRIAWSCDMQGQRFQKYVMLWMEGGKIARLGVFDCINSEGRSRC